MPLYNKSEKSSTDLLINESLVQINNASAASLNTILSGAVEARKRATEAAQTTLLSLKAENIAVVSHCKARDNFKKTHVVFLKAHKVFKCANEQFKRADRDLATHKHDLQQANLRSAESVLVKETATRTEAMERNREARSKVRKTEQQLLAKQLTRMNAQNSERSLISAAALCQHRAIVKASEYLQYQTAHEFVAKQLRRPPSLAGKVRDVWPFLLAIIQFALAGSNFSKLDDLFSMEAIRMAFKDNFWVHALWSGMLGSVRLGLLPLLLVYFIIASLTDVIDDSTFFMNLITTVSIVFGIFVAIASIYWHFLQTHSISYYSIIMPLLLTIVLFILSRISVWDRRVRNVLFQETVLTLFLPYFLIIYQHLPRVTIGIVIAAALCIPPVFELLRPSQGPAKLNQATPVIKTADNDARPAPKRNRLLILLFVSILIWIMLLRNDQPKDRIDFMVVAPPMQIYRHDIRQYLWLLDTPSAPH